MGRKRSGRRKRRRPFQAIRKHRGRVRTSTTTRMKARLSFGGHSAVPPALAPRPRARDAPNLSRRKATRKMKCWCGGVLTCVRLLGHAFNASRSVLRYRNPLRPRRPLRLHCTGRHSGPGRYRRRTRLVMPQSASRLLDNEIPVHAHLPPTRMPRPPRRPRSLSRLLKEKSANAPRQPHGDQRTRDRPDRTRHSRATLL